MIGRWMFTVVVAALCAAPVQAKKKYDPFLVPRDQIVGRMKTVALRGIAGLPKEYSGSDSVRATFESLFTAELEHAGYKVIPATIYEHLRQEGVDSLGGALFDPKTGAADTTRTRQLQAWSMQRLKERHQADALLLPQFVPMSASFSSGTAHWDGTSQKLWKGMEGKFGFLDKRSGTIPAMSLLVLIEDTDGKTLYMDSGGLSLMSRIKGSHFEDLPEDSLYGNPQRNGNAVRLALGALTRADAK